MNLITKSNIVIAALILTLVAGCGKESVIEREVTEELELLGEYVSSKLKEIAPHAKKRFENTKEDLAKGDYPAFIRVNQSYFLSDKNTEIELFYESILWESSGMIESLTNELESPEFKEGFVFRRVLSNKEWTHQPCLVFKGFKVYSDKGKLLIDFEEKYMEEFNEIRETTGIIRTHIDKIKSERKANYE